MRISPEQMTAPVTDQNHESTAWRRRGRVIHRGCSPCQGENGMPNGGTMGDTLRNQALIDALTGIVSRAGQAILKARAGALATRQKADRSPVTAADEASEAVILEGLARVLP